MRVGLSFLETVEMVRRYQDVPRAMTLCWRQRGQDAEVDGFAASVHLRPGQTVDRSFRDLCEQSGIAPDALESTLLQWQDAGWISVAASGRDLLLELLPPPKDGTERVKALLDRYAAISEGRIGEIVSYAGTRRCLHGHIGNYLGGYPRQRCDACDRCLGDDLLPATSADLPDEAAQLETILTILAEQSWGRRTLVNLLKGDPKAGDRAAGSPHFGALGLPQPYRAG